MTQSSLEVTDIASASVQKTPNRVALSDIEAKIANVEYFNPESASHFTIAILTLTNGYVVLGESAPADPENYNKELGEQFARENAIRKVWPLMGYALCDKLSA
jgi:hypothetical protein